MICRNLIGHNGCGIAIDKYYLNAFFSKRTCGLTAAVIKFAGLADDDWAATYYKNTIYGGVFRHFSDWISGGEDRLDLW